MMSRKLLIIEDDPDMFALMRDSVSDLGFEIDGVHDGADGLTRAMAGDYALVIVDVTLPRLSGFEICSKLRSEKKNLPVIMVTSRSEEIDKVLGLELGADDYITKPFSTRELSARVKAVLRRAEVVANSVNDDSDVDKIFTFGNLEINVTKRQVFVSQKPIELTALEFDLLVFLASRPGRPFSREQLIEEVWGYQVSEFDPTVTTHISRLRSKIEPDPGHPVFIKTVRGLGYRFAEPQEFV